MGTVYRKSYTKPLPAGALVTVRNGRQVAEWKADVLADYLGLALVRRKAK